MPHGGRCHPEKAKVLSVVQGSCEVKIILIIMLKRHLAFLLLYMYNRVFQKHQDMRCCPRLNAEAEMRIQLSSIKPDIKEICKNIK